MKKIIILLMAVLFVMPMIFSCKDTGTDSKPGTNSNDGSELVSEDDSDKSAYERFKYKDQKFNNVTVTILTKTGTSNADFSEIQYVYDEEFAANAINEAVKKRNDYIQENHGIIIKTISREKPLENFKTEVADELEYDIVSSSIDTLLVLGVEGYFYALNDYVDLDDPWWDPSVKQMTVDGKKHMFLSGDGLITDKASLYLFLYNKDLYEKEISASMGSKSIYDIVRDGEWTMDKLLEIGANFSTPDANGQWNLDARYAYITETYASTLMMNGAGIPLAEASADGTIRTTIEDQKSIDVFDKIFNIMSNKQFSIIAENMGFKYGSGWADGYAMVDKIWEESRGLFKTTTVAGITNHLDKDIPFTIGILPMPKYDEQQEDYYTCGNRYSLTCLGIPVAVEKEKIEAAAFAMNAMGFYNKALPDNVWDAYYHVTLKSQGSDKTDDENMLDIIFENKITDIGSIFTWGMLLHLYTNSINGNETTNTSQSKWQAMKPAVEAAIEDTIKSYKENVK
ncbi:hypothetical protein LJB90_01285 [Eubacteriales bacterium OttesenSCG-928-G02]|nr:hypothetical protein [Eubacteriales bacterium OttesenSCG-928-G02]